MILFSEILLNDSHFSLTIVILCIPFIKINKKGFFTYLPIWNPHHSGDVLWTSLKPDVFKCHLAYTEMIIKWEFFFQTVSAETRMQFPLVWKIFYFLIAWSWFMIQNIDIFMSNTVHHCLKMCFNNRFYYNLCVMCILILLEFYFFYL